MFTDNLDEISFFTQLTSDQAHRLNLQIKTKIYFVNHKMECIIWSKHMMKINLSCLERFEKLKIYKHRT